MLEQAFCDMSTARAPQRLARVLLRLTKHAPCSSPDSLGLSREELAQMIGTTLFTISRLLRDWAERQIVYVSRNGLVIENMEALQQLAEHGDDDEECLPEIA
jgi:CRP-like cAMP-binding protein